MAGGWIWAFLIAASSHKAPSAAAHATTRVVERAPEVLDLDRMSNWLNSSVVALVILNGFALLLFMASFLAPQLTQLKKTFGEKWSEWKDSRALKRAMKQQAKDQKADSKAAALTQGVIEPQVVEAPIAAAAETTAVASPPTEAAAAATETPAEAAPEVPVEAAPPPVPEATENPLPPESQAIDQAIEAAKEELSAPPVEPPPAEVAPSPEVEASPEAAPVMEAAAPEVPPETPPAAAPVEEVPAPEPAAFTAPTEIAFVEETTQTIELERPAAFNPPPALQMDAVPEVTEILPKIPVAAAESLQASDSSLPPAAISDETDTKMPSDRPPPAGASNASRAKESIVSALSEVPSDMTEEIPIFDPSTLDQAFGAGSGKRRSKQKRPNG